MGSDRSLAWAVDSSVAGEVATREVDELTNDDFMGMLYKYFENMHALAHLDCSFTTWA
jgi:hypothetical protein